MKNSTLPVQVGPYKIGGANFVVIAGPCSIESQEQLSTTAQFVKDNGAAILRGGMFKLRTHPDSFQGLGANAFSIVREVKEKTGMPFISEITDPRQLSDLAEIVDIFQVGSRNMHNYALLKELGTVKKPVLLKRGFSGLIKEWLYSAEYITKSGNTDVILCERGIRTFENATRNTFDINAIAYIKAHTSFPIIADPSHGTGASELVTPIALSAAAAGADGLIVEVHPNPKEAQSDGFQALTFDMYADMMIRLEKILKAVDRRVEKVQ